MPDATDQRLLDEFQRGLPLVTRPFASVAAALGIAETEVIARLAVLKALGMISRVGATIHPNTAGASTLAALAIPDDRIEDVAARVSAEPGVNHAYLRENEWNFWFVSTAPSQAALAESLQRISRMTVLPILQLPLLRPFNIDLGFCLSGPQGAPRTSVVPDTSVILASDRPLLQAMAEGLPLTVDPYAILARRLKCDEATILDRLASLLAAGIIARVGVIVRHRALGWSSNAMVVWDLPEENMETAGHCLAALPGVTLCYQRRTVPGVWPYGLYCMIHARSRLEAHAVLAVASSRPELAGARHRVLFSTRCFKQSGALVHGEGIAA